MPVIIGSAANVAEYHNIEIRANKLGKLCAAIAFRISGNILPDPAGLPSWALLKQLVVLGHGERTTIIRLTDQDPPPSANYLLVPSAYARMVDATVGMYRFPEVIDIGEATELEARQRGRQILQNGWDLLTERTYVIRSQIASKPDRGETITMMSDTEEFTGVLQDLHYRCSGGDETLTLRLIDYENPTYSP